MQFYKVSDDLQLLQHAREASCEAQALKLSKGYTQYLWQGKLKGGSIGGEVRPVQDFLRGSDALQRGGQSQWHQKCYQKALHVASSCMCTWPCMQVCRQSDGVGATLGDSLLHIRLVQCDPHGPGAGGQVRHIHHSLHVGLRLLSPRQGSRLEDTGTQGSLPWHQPKGEHNPRHATS